MTPNIAPSNICEFLHKDNLVIFLFHGVIKKQIHSVRNYTMKHIEGELFDEYMGKLAHQGSPISMNMVLDHLDKKKPFSPGSFAITFDDGFENNISVAAPILEKYNIPAMIYLTTDFIQNNRMSWIDRIEYAVQKTKKSKITLQVNDNTYPLNHVDEKINFLRVVRELVKKTPTCNPNLFAHQVCSDLGFPSNISSDDPLDLKLSWDQIQKIHKDNGLLSFGGHSHTHPILSFLSSDDLSYELDRSISLMKHMADIDSTHYSYPEGLAHCYSDEVIRELKQRGVRCCPTAIQGNNSLDMDPFKLFRIMVA
ncbi:polysaccharide deacetylase family protein [Polynucleobacter sp. MWH-UH19D]|uniref:polysaccharide deacetylase family protein n=1 Tax=Polynucleobacter sp. MWH-UH19D TaxID=1855610 RepID=UPI0033650210